MDYALASMILAAVSITHANYIPQTNQVFLLTIFLLLTQACIGSMPTKWLANFNSVGSTLNIMALVIVIILIPIQSNREDQGLPRFTSSKVVWGSFYDGTGFSNGLSLLMSFVGVIWTMRSALGLENCHIC